MSTARFEYVATQRAPKRAVVKAEFDPSGYTNTMECGHIARTVAHMCIKVGDQLKCYECGRIAARQLPEFNQGEHTS